MQDFLLIVRTSRLKSFSFFTPAQFFGGGLSPFDPNRDPNGTGSGRRQRRQNGRIAASPLLNSLKKRWIMLLENSPEPSGPRGRGFKSRHSDQKSSDFSLLLRIIRTFLLYFSVSQHFRPKPRPKRGKNEGAPYSFGTPPFCCIFSPFIPPGRSGLPPFEPPLSAFRRSRECRYPA